MKRLFSIVCLAVMLSGSVQGQRRRQRHPGVFEATAFVQEGTTASGRETHRGEVAADKRILPPGTRIRVWNAGDYSGIDTVADTGRDIQGRHIDIFIPDAQQAKVFGKRTVRIRVLRWGTRTVAER